MTEKCLGFAELLKTHAKTAFIISEDVEFADENEDEYDRVAQQKWVSVDVLKQWQEQFQDFLSHNDRNLLEMFCQQGPPTKHWIETEGQYWAGWHDSNKKVKEFFGEALLGKGSLQEKKESDKP